MTALIEAEARAAAARARLGDTVATLQTRLDPKALARDAVDGIADTGSRAVRAGVAGVKRNPAVATGAALGIALVLARKPIARWLSGLRKR